MAGSQYRLKISAGAFTNGTGGYLLLKLLKPRFMCRLLGSLLLLLAVQLTL